MAVTRRVRKITPGADATRRLAQKHRRPPDAVRRAPRLNMTARVLSSPLSSFWRSLLLFSFRRTTDGRSHVACHALTKHHMLSLVSPLISSWLPSWPRLAVCWRLIYSWFASSAGWWVSRNPSGSRDSCSRGLRQTCVKPPIALYGQLGNLVLSFSVCLVSYGCFSLTS